MWVWSAFFRPSKATPSAEKVIYTDSRPPFTALQFTPVRASDYNGLLSQRKRKIKLDNAQLNTGVPLAPSVPVSPVWRTIKSFIFWSHERGTIQYDIMVTVILLFVFLSPLVISFNDRPVQRNPQASGVMVYPDGTGEFVYQVDANGVPSGNDEAIRNALLNIIEPISGSVSISRYEAITDTKGKVIAYKVWVQRE